MHSGLHIVLDLDSTLIYSLPYKVGDPLNGDDIIDLDDSMLRIKIRPFAIEFLQYCFTHFKSVSIWSAGEYEYVHAIAKLLLRKLGNRYSFRFIYTRDDCIYDRDGYIVKPLEIIWDRYRDMNIDNTMILDDTKETFRYNRDNAVHAKAYRGGKNDRYLYDLILWFSSR